MDTKEKINAIVEGLNEQEAKFILAFMESVFNGRGKENK